MPETWADAAAGAVAAMEGGQPLPGVAVAQVISNLDSTNQGRVQVQLPWLPGIEPWARVAAGSAGGGRGMYFIPQVGEEVLVAFQHGDVRDVFILGTLWNATDRPPSESPLDPVNRRVIRTPVGHQIELHDLKQSVTVTTSTGQTLTLTPEKIEVTTTGGTAKVVLETSGAVSVTAATSIELKAPSITLDAATLELKGSASAKLTAGAVCEIQGGMVKIN
jgi:phage baseplate assembly protein V